MSTENTHKENDKVFVIISYDGEYFTIEMSQKFLGKDGEVTYKVPATPLEARFILTDLSEAPGINDKVRSAMKKIALKIAPEDKQATTDPQSSLTTTRKITRQRTKKEDN